MFKFVFCCCICVAALVKAQPNIDHLAVDEAQERLIIYGSFSSVPGSVTVNDTTLEVITWSDSLVVVELPNQGKGAGGEVVVSDQIGKSLGRNLSIFNLKVSNPFFHTIVDQSGVGFIQVDTRIWDVNWRADIGARNSATNTIVKFEISRSSLGYRGYVKILTLPWSDTSQTVDSSISLSGTMDLKNRNIIFDTARINTTPPTPTHLATVQYKPHTIRFDSTGFISGYLDSGRSFVVFPGVRWADSLYDQQILFPPSPKSAVAYGRLLDAMPLLISTDHIKLTNPKSQRVSIACYDYLGRQVLSIFDGQLTSGAHALPVSKWPSCAIYFLVVKTEDGQVVGKVINR